jgi:hypothetical protein
VCYNYRVVRLLKNVIPFKPSHYFDETRILITEEEMGSENGPPKGRVVGRESG